jgi:IS5 family transposase
MKPQQTPQDDLLLFQAHFDQLLNPDHPLVNIARQIDWDQFDRVFGGCYCEDNGAPAKSTRLMVGLHYLKHTFNESDESVVARWVENPYWQYFCGYTHLQHACPIHPTSMTRWRQRVGVDANDDAESGDSSGGNSGGGPNELLKQTIAVAVRQKHLPERELKQVNVDTTVQEKNVTHPTDSKLLYKAIVKLGVAAKTRRIVLRQSYVRVGKRASVKAGRYAHARQFNRMRRQLRKLRTWAGRMIRDIERKAPTKDEELATLLNRCQRLVDQQPGDSNKLYSLHEPEVCCISKGKAHKRYEFGQKVALATTNRRDWFVGALLCPGNPYDGHTLKATLQHVESNTGVPLSDAYVDKGYRGHDYAGDAQVHIAGSGSKRLTRTQRRRRKRRSAIEPKIGHVKSDNRMGRCYLKGLTGDAMNVVLAAAGANLRKLLRLSPCALRQRVEAIAHWLHQAIQSPSACLTVV